MATDKDESWDAPPSAVVQQEADAWSEAPSVGVQAAARVAAKQPKRPDPGAAKAAFFAGFNGLTRGGFDELTGHLGAALEPLLVGKGVQLTPEAQRAIAALPADQRSTANQMSGFTGFNASGVPQYTKSEPLATGPNGYWDRYRAYRDQTQEAHDAGVEHWPRLTAVTEGGAGLASSVATGLPPVLDGALQGFLNSRADLTQKPELLTTDADGKTVWGNVGNAVLDTGLNALLAKAGGDLAQRSGLGKIPVAHLLNSGVNLALTEALMQDAPDYLKTNARWQFATGLAGTGALAARNALGTKVAKAKTAALDEALDQPRADLAKASVEQQDALLKLNGMERDPRVLQSQAYDEVTAPFYKAREAWNNKAQEDFKDYSKQISTMTKRAERTAQTDYKAKLKQYNDLQKALKAELAAWEESTATGAPTDARSKAERLIDEAQKELSPEHLQGVYNSTLGGETFGALGRLKSYEGIGRPVPENLRLGVNEMLSTFDRNSDELGQMLAKNGMLPKELAQQARAAAEAAGHSKLAQASQLRSAESGGGARASIDPEVVARAARGESVRLPGITHDSVTGAPIGNNPLERLAARARELAQARGFAEFPAGPPEAAKLGNDFILSDEMAALHQKYPGFNLKVDEKTGRPVPVFPEPSQDNGFSLDADGHVVQRPVEPESKDSYDRLMYDRGRPFMPEPPETGLPFTAPEPDGIPSAPKAAIPVDAAADEFLGGPSEPRPELPRQDPFFTPGNLNSTDIFNKKLLAVKKAEQKASDASRTLKSAQAAASPEAAYKTGRGALAASTAKGAAAGVGAALGLPLLGPLANLVGVPSSVTAGGIGAALGFAKAAFTNPAAKAYLLDKVDGVLKNDPALSQRYAKYLASQQGGTIVQALRLAHALSQDPDLRAAVDSKIESEGSAR